MGDLSSEDALEKVNVLVTGFGPFGSHAINSSWQGVQELERMGLSDSVNLVTREIDVVYTTVRSLIPSLWDELKPKLVVHVGVSGIAREITLEQQAHNHGYDKQDAAGCLPDAPCCVHGAPECLVSQLDMNTVKSKINAANCGVTATVSHDPGRYLCDFIYYTSLNINTACTAFIHVPPLNKPYTAAQLGHGIRLAVLAMLEQVLGTDSPECLPILCQEQQQSYKKLHQSKQLHQSSSELSPSREHHSSAHLTQASH